MQEDRFRLAVNQRRSLGIQGRSRVYSEGIRGEAGQVTGSIQSSQGGGKVSTGEEGSGGVLDPKSLVGSLTKAEIDELRPWLLAVSLDSDGNADLVGGYLAADRVKIHDSDDSNHLSLVWNEDDSADRVFNILVHGANRSLELYESLTIADGYDVTLQALGQANSLILNEGLTIGNGYSGTITFSGEGKTLTIDETETLSSYHTDARGDARYYTKTEFDIWASDVIAQEMDYLDGVTSDIQTQLDGKAAIGEAAGFETMFLLGGM